MKIIFLLQTGCNPLAPTKQKILIEPLALFIDVDRNNMYMVTVNVLMLVNNVRLLSETELIKILARKYLKI